MWHCPGPHKKGACLKDEELYLGKPRAHCAQFSPRGGGGEAVLRALACVVDRFDALRCFKSCAMLTANK